MLEPEILKPYLLDQDRWVRTAAARYFDESWSQDEELVPLILDACDRFGYLDTVSLLGCCRRLPLTPTAFDQVLQRLAKAPHDNTVMHLSGILARAPVDLLREHKDAVLGNEHLLEDHRRSIRHRLDLMPWSGERLWQELQKRASQYEASDDWSNSDATYDDAILDALTYHDVPDAKTISQILVDSTTMGGWLEIFLVDLAGSRRLTETIPALCNMLRRTTEMLPDSCPEALARIGHPEIVRRIKSIFPTGPFLFRDTSATLLGEIKHPESEDAILTLLKKEDDVDIRTELCYGLCQLFSEQGVEVVRQQIADGYNESLVSLEEALLPVAKILGIELPESERWREQREELEQLQLDRRRELDEFGPDFDPLKVQGDDPFAPSGSIRGNGQGASTTYHHHENKVGRNDPCPCGSGKKYKKCCEGKS